MAVTLSDVKTIVLASLLIFQTENISASEVRSAKIASLQISKQETVAASEVRTTKLAQLIISAAEAVAASQNVPVPRYPLLLSASEQITASESKTTNLAQLIVQATEAVTSAEIITVVVGEAPAPQSIDLPISTDATAILDSASVQVNPLRIQRTETISVLDSSSSVLAQLVRQSSETIGISDSPNTLINPLIFSREELIGCLDSSVSLVNPLITQSSEFIASSETVPTPYIEIPIVVYAVDTVGIHDNFYSLGPPFEVVDISDFPTVTVQAFPDINVPIKSEDISVSDTPTTRINPLRISRQESLGVVDTGTALRYQLILSRSDTARISELKTIRLDPLIVQKTETLSLSESTPVGIGVVQAINVSAAEYVGINDTFYGLGPPYEFVDVSDSFTVEVKEPTSFISMQEVVGVSDSTSINVGIKIENIENVPVSDSSIINLSFLEIRATDYIDASETSENKLSDLSIQASESIAASELPPQFSIISFDLDVSQYETVGILDTPSSILDSLLIQFTDYVDVIETSTSYFFPGAPGVILLSNGRLAMRITDTFYLVL